MKAKVGLPKSEHIAQTLEREIREGRIVHGDQLESESRLMRRFSVSRNTVRKGLESLAHQGLITTRSGIGSFATYDGEAIDNNLGWTLALAKGSNDIETRTLSICRASCTLADNFLQTSQDYLCIDRLRFCQSTGQGISLERSRLPWRDDFADIPREGLRGGSLNQTLTDLRIFTDRGEEWVGVRPALSLDDASVMLRQPGLPMMHLRRVTRAADGSVIEYVESLLDPDRFGMHMEF
jgi:GntR family transcriptional regulator